MPRGGSGTILEAPARSRKGPGRRAAPRWRKKGTLCDPSCFDLFFVSHCLLSLSFPSFLFLYITLFFFFFSSLLFFFLFPFFSLYFFFFLFSLCLLFLGLSRRGTGRMHCTIIGRIFGSPPAPFSMLGSRGWRCGRTSASPPRATASIEKGAGGDPINWQTIVRNLGGDPFAIVPVGLEFEVAPFCCRRGHSPCCYRC